MADPADRAGVMVPVQDPLYRLATQLAKAAASGEGSKKDKKKEEAPPPSALKGKGKGADKGKDKGAVSFGQDSYDPMGGSAEYGVYAEEGYEDDYTPPEAASYDLGGMGGKMVAGVWMPTVGTAAGAMAGAGGAKQKDGLGNDVHSSIWSRGTGKPVSLPTRAPKSVPQTLPQKAEGPAKVEKSKKSASMADIQAEQQQEAQEPVRVRKDVLMKGLLGKMVMCHSIQHFQGALPVYGNGPVPSVNITVDVVRGNKQMTRLQGLEAFTVDLNQLAKGIQKKFASAASVGPQVTNPKVNEVCVQGNLSAQAEDFLVSQYGFRKSMITAPVGGGKGKGKKK